MDTGAAFNHLSTSVATRHLKDNLSNTKHTLEGTGLDGRPVQLALLTLDPLIIGSYKVHRVTFTYPVEEPGSKPQADASVLSHELNVAGILGNPFFEHFLVTIDCPFHRLLLEANPQFEISYQFDEALTVGDTALFTKRDFRQSEFAYQKALAFANNAHNICYQALSIGRLGNLRRIMAHDLRRPEHAQLSYQYFKKADQLVSQAHCKDAQGRILADWSLLYSDNGQLAEAKQTIEKAISLAPKDPFVNVDYVVHLFREHDYAEAKNIPEKVLFFDPGNWQGLWYQVKLNEMFSDYPKQRAALKEILQYYPWSKVAQTKLTEVEKQMGIGQPTIEKKKQKPKSIRPTLRHCIN